MASLAEMSGGRVQTDLTRKLEALRRDFAEVDGKVFTYFFCPLLFKDEDVELCRAHVVNAAFRASSRRWTVQRRDVDNFFGSHFESDFVDLQHRQRGLAARAVVDPHLHRRLRPKLNLDGQLLEYFVTDGPIPDGFSLMVFEEAGQQVRLAVKIPPADVSAKMTADWQIEIRKDVRLAAFVSVLKAAHLTLFEMLGYRYAMGNGGRYLGELLGRFFSMCTGQARQAVRKQAVTYFTPLSAMVRPVNMVKTKSIARGSIDDGVVRVCWSPGGHAWAGMVFVRTGSLVNAALVPVFDDAIGRAEFERFLLAGHGSFEVSTATFENGRWSLSGERVGVEWPKASLS